MRPIWAPAARADVEAIHAYIAETDRAAANRTVDRLIGIAPMLAEHPGIGRPGRVETTREFVVSRTPYIVVYRRRGRLIEIVRILHAARSWPADF